MSLLTHKDKEQIRKQIENSERLVKEEADRTNAKFKKLIEDQVVSNRESLNNIENAPRIEEAVRLLELNKEAYIKSMEILKQHIVGLKKSTHVNFDKIRDVIESNGKVVQLVNNTHTEYIRNLNPQTQSIATALYDRYMDAREKIFKFATISIEEDESLGKALVGSLGKALVGIKSDSDSESSRSRSSSYSTATSRSVAKTDELINNIFELRTLAKSTFRYLTRRKKKNKSPTSSIDSEDVGLDSDSVRLPSRGRSRSRSRNRGSDRSRSRNRK
jgi:hypothetical protein